MKEKSSLIRETYYVHGRSVSHSQTNNVGVCIRVQLAVITGSNWLKPAPDESWSFFRSNRLEVLGGGASDSSGSGT